MPTPSRPSLRRFGLSVGGVFLLLGTVSAWRGHTIPPVVCWTLGTPLVLLGAVAPAALGPVERAWMAMAERLGRINSRVILTLLYWVVLTPVGALRRWRHDPLDRRMHDGRPSVWVQRPRGAIDPQRYRQQF
jgi:hypothetical protein